LKLLAELIQFPEFTGKLLKYLAPLVATELEL